MHAVEDKSNQAHRWWSWDSIWYFPSEIFPCFSFSLIYFNLTPKSVAACFLIHKHTLTKEWTGEVSWLRRMRRGDNRMSAERSINAWHAYNSWIQARRGPDHGQKCWDSRLVRRVLHWPIWRKIRKILSKGSVGSTVRLQDRRYLNSNRVTVWIKWIPRLPFSCQTHPRARIMYHSESNPCIEYPWFEVFNWFWLINVSHVTYWTVTTRTMECGTARTEHWAVYKGLASAYRIPYWCAFDLNSNVVRAVREGLDLLVTGIPVCPPGIFHSKRGRRMQKLQRFQVQRTWKSFSLVEVLWEPGGCQSPQNLITWGCILNSHAWYNKEGHCVVRHVHQAMGAPQMSGHKPRCHRTQLNGKNHVCRCTGHWRMGWTVRQLFGAVIGLANERTHGAAHNQRSAWSPAIQGAEYLSSRWIASDRERIPSVEIL